jgi:hypothetical protein
VLYGIEINEPYQANTEYKFRINLRVIGNDQFSYTSKPHYAFATDDKAFAEELAATLAPSYEAAVVPLEEGETHHDKAELLKAFKERGRTRLQQARQIRA